MIKIYIKGERHILFKVRVSAHKINIKISSNSSMHYTTNLCKYKIKDKSGKSEYMRMDNQ